MSEDKAKGSDKFVGKTQPSPEAAQFIDKLKFAYDTVGMSAMFTLKQPHDLLCGIAHCIANKNHAPQYENVMRDIAMFLYVQDRVREDLINNAMQQVQEGSMDSATQEPAIATIMPVAEQDVMPQEIPTPLCKGCGQRHPLTTVPAARVAICGIEDPYGNDGVLIQLQEKSEHNAGGLHAIFHPSEAKIISDRLSGLLSQLETKKGN